MTKKKIKDIDRRQSFERNRKLSNIADFRLQTRTVVSGGGEG